ncbi:MAG TPA: quinone-dependent dihydroorotate dehydrogenase [Thermoanaerobaculia bacterium]|jgi:dihydroorotate dehydrogenase|nr:quinone-dependent dihydroorotate dehydrogenase [Thermoanaerobaculia bacterium]
MPILVGLYPLLRPLLFCLDAETGHEVGLAALRAAQTLPGWTALGVRRSRAADSRLARPLLGTTFPNPIGLAAGFDKDGRAVRGLAALGFGFVEIGTVTPLPQSGNPRPRMFRHPKLGTLQNALGFNNRGMAAMVAALAALERLGPPPVPLGINLGKNKATPPERAIDDYEILLRGLERFADYLVINLSSPNTPGLRDLQNESFLRELFRRAEAITAKPILVKISPDLLPAAAAELTTAALDQGAAGLIATNTTIDYDLVPGCEPRGGLSGRILRARSFAMLQAIAPRIRDRGVLIAVGGIDSGEEALRRLDAGAHLVQLYTGMVFEGPGLPRRMVREMAARTAEK